jgi:hypothetical protein
MKEMNLKPGPQVKSLLEKVREAQLEALAKGDEFTREDALKTLRIP